MQRNQMIETLLTDNLLTSLDRRHPDYRRDLHRNRYQDFARMSDSALRAEISRRGLSELAATVPDFVEDDSDILLLAGLRMDFGRGHLRTSFEEE